jgi:precorrin-2 dehydrogenase/sirohydrochlorin ferrochelatase
MSADPLQPYAVMLTVARKLAVVVGAGPRAVRAAKTLVAHGADVVVISADAPDELVGMESDGLLSVETRGYIRGDLDGAFLAVIASGSAVVDAAVLEEARESKVLANVPGDAEASDFIVPSVVRRGELQIAISTGGMAPATTAEVRGVIKGEFGPEWAAYVELMGELRTLAMERTGLSDAELAPLFASIDGSVLRDRLIAGQTITAKDLYDQNPGAVPHAAKKTKKKEAQNDG